MLHIDSWCLLILALNILTVDILINKFSSRLINEHLFDSPIFI